jgi:transcriptional regulator with XRE-family HTH domain
MFVTVDKLPLQRFMERLLQERNVSIRALALYMNVSDRTVRRMLEGETPDPETLKKLAEYANYPVEDLFRMVGWFQIPDSDVKSETINEIEAMLNDLSPDAQRKIRDMIRVEWEYNRNRGDADQADEPPAARKAS